MPTWPLLVTPLDLITPEELQAPVPIKVLERTKASVENRMDVLLSNSDDFEEVTNQVIDLVNNMSDYVAMRKGFIATGPLDLRGKKVIHLPAGNEKSLVTYQDFLALQTNIEILLDTVQNKILLSSGGLATCPFNMNGNNIIGNNDSQSGKDLVSKSMLTARIIDTFASGLPTDGSQAMGGPLDMSFDPPTGPTQSFAIVNLGHAVADYDALPKDQCDTLVDGGTYAIAVPPGAVIASLAPPNQVPSTWLLCNGAEYSEANYARLYSIIGTLYGSGVQPLTFKVPDVRGTLITGSSDNAEPTRVQLALGASFGFVNAIITVANLPSHSHEVKLLLSSNDFIGDPDAFFIYPPIGSTRKYYYTVGSGTRISVELIDIRGAAGEVPNYPRDGQGNLLYDPASPPHNNVQPSLALNFYIVA